MLTNKKNKIKGKISPITILCGSVGSFPKTKSTTTEQLWVPSMEHSQNKTRLTEHAARVQVINYVMFVNKYNKANDYPKQP